MFPPPWYSCSCRQTGGTTRRYEQFLAYLAAKDPSGRIQVATLPFEGRNKVLYRLPYNASGSWRPQGRSCELLG